MSRCHAIAIASVLIAFFATSVIWPVAAQAHAFPEAERPLVGSTMQVAPTEVKITYDAPIEPLFSKLRVLNGDGVVVSQNPPLVGPNHRTLSVKLKPLNPGDYTVKWSVVAEDGHRTEGSYEFSVAGAGS